MAVDLTLVLPDVGNLFGMVKEAFRHEYHLGLAALAAAGKKHGMEIDLLDMQVEGMDEEGLRRHLDITRPRVVGITLLTPLYAHSRRLVSTIRAAAPEAVILAGGSHATALPERTMAENPALDILCYGEADETLIEVIDALTSKSALASVRGIVRRDGGRIVVNPPRPLITDLDSLPFPWRRPDRIDRYLAPIYFHTDRPYVNILSSRGCPYRCSFCGQEVTFGNKVRSRSAANVVDEMEFHRRENGIEIFFFDDSTFVYDPRRVKTICAEIKQRLPGIRWGGMGRINLCDPDMLSTMRQAGCEMLHFGVESGDQRILDVIHKQIDLDQARAAIRAVRRAGILSNASFILGLPGDTLESIQRTIDFAIQLDSDFVSFSLATPYPGTEFYDIAVQEGFDPADWALYATSRYSEPVYLAPGLKRDELVSMYKSAYRRVYRRPRLLLRELLKIDNYLNPRRTMALARKLVFAR